MWAKNFKARFDGANGLTFMTRAQMEDFHTQVLDLLNSVGMEVQHKKALELCEKAGCRVVKKRVYFPPTVVEWAIKAAPSRILLYDRDGNFALDVSGRNAWFGVGSAEPNIIDPYTLKPRLCTEEDNKNAVKVADAMPYIDFMMSNCQVYDHPITSYEHEYAAMIRYSSKPQVVITGGYESTKNVVEIASMVRGGEDKLAQKPLFILYSEPISPLVCNKDSIDELEYVAERNIPVLYAPIPMNGATGPITMEANIIQGVAECLVGLVLAELFRPGAPFLFGGILTNMDMKSLQPTYASPETQVESLAMAEIGRELYHLPTWGTCGCTSSKMSDEQAVLEGTQYITMAALSGANINHDIGYTTFGLTLSLDYVVMMNDVIGRMRRIADSVKPCPENNLMDDIKEVGPKGHFLGQESTLYRNKENWESDLEDRYEYDKWMSAGGTTMRDKAIAKVRDIIENGELNALPKEMDDQIVEFLNKIDAEERKTRPEAFADK